MKKKKRIDIVPHTNGWAIMVNDNNKLSLIVDKKTELIIYNEKSKIVKRIKLNKKIR